MTLETLADGSVLPSPRPRDRRRARPLPPHQKGLLKSLPTVDWQAAHTLGDELGGAAADPRLALFFDLLLALIARLIRARASGEGAADDIALANRLIHSGGQACLVG